MAKAAETRRIAFSVYWKLAVFGLLVAVICGAVAGFIVGFISSILGYKDFSQSIAAVVFYSLVGISANFFVFNYVLARSIGVQFGKFRLELVKAP